MNEHKKNKISGITLIALVVTVIVLLILAGISASMLSGNNGIINKAGSAKEQTEIAKEKEAIGTAALQAANKGKFGDITQENLQQQINNEFGEEKNAKVYDEEENFLVLIENRLYKVDKDGNVDLSESNFEFPKKEFLVQLSNNELGTSEDKPYEIRCIEDLLDFSLTVNGITIENNEIKYITGKNFSGKYVSVVKNLDFKLPLSYENAERIDYGDINQDGKVEKLLTELTTGKGWICIGGYGSTKNGAGFSGIFEGNSKYIRNLYINNTDSVSTNGMFGSATKAIIKELNVTGYINCVATKAGGIVGIVYNNNIELKSCSFNGDITNTGYAGGIVGHLWGTSFTIEQCNCKGKITSLDNQSAGIIGRIDGNSGGNITNSYNEASIKGKSNVAGIVGNTSNGNVECKIIKCYNKGNIHASGWAAGIVSQTYCGVEECFNEGNVNSTGSMVGGIVGRCGISNERIFKCFNKGKISGNTEVGGILGSCYAAKQLTIEQCYNLGEIIANEANGTSAGISGSISSSTNTNILNCYNANKISGKNCRGIVHAGAGNPRVISCYNFGSEIGGSKYGITNKNIAYNSYHLNTCGATDSNTTSVTIEELKQLTLTLDKLYTIDEETRAVTISETEIQNVWKEDTENKNEGYPIFKWQ